MATRWQAAFDDEFLNRLASYPCLAQCHGLRFASAPLAMEEVLPDRTS
jgi:hypothetical protein